jgi:predicted DNA binding CopG/RHH family protein
MSDNNETVKITFNLPKKEFDILNLLAEELKMTKTDVIRRGLKLENYIQDVIEKKEKILIEKNGVYKELIIT